MSASLVGSEMCIRDSSSCLLLHAAVGRTLRAEQGQDHSGCLLLHAAVSYTHLTLPTICSV
eukprot:11879710-Alexandrium_andersonii.AAC.1